jgi:peroxiredoxin Q/BCP
VQILGCSFDDEKANRAFAEKFAYQFPLLCDTNRDVGMKYGAADSPDAGAAKRISYLIDPKGKIRKVWGKVVPKGHAADVLDTVKAG